MLLETVVIYVYYGAEFTATNMESKMTNFTTQGQYQTFCDYLNALCNQVKGALVITRAFHNSEFKDNLGNKAVLVSDATDGAEYGILNGELYPPSLILHINGLLKAEGKDLPIWHSDYKSLEYHTRQVCSRDFRFIHQIDALPKTAEDRRKALGIEFIPDDRKKQLQDELEEVLVQKENYINEDPDSPDYDSDYEQSELWGNRESEIVDELEKLEG